jgi:hypothetical protein
MSLLVVALIAVLLTAVVAVVSAPLRARSAADPDRPGSPPDPGAPRPTPDPSAPRPRSAAQDEDVSEAERRAELDAARDAKYREIRDAELDFRTGKLSDEDYRALDAALRAEGAEILCQLDHLPAR